jgi:hypothetical protein
MSVSSEERCRTFRISSLDSTRPDRSSIFTGVFTSTLTDLSNHPLGTVSFQGTIGETIFGRTNATQLGTWNTEITSLDLTGMFQGSTLRVSQDTDNESLGGTTIAEVSEEFLITSFFDIFVDIELASVPPLTTGRGPLHAELQAVPEPGSLTLFLLPLAGLAALRQHGPGNFRSRRPRARSSRPVAGNVLIECALASTPRLSAGAPDIAGTG